MNYRITIPFLFASIVAMEKEINIDSSVPMLKDLAARAVVKYAKNIKFNKNMLPQEVEDLVIYHQPITSKNVSKILEMAKARNEIEKQKSCIRFIIENQKIVSNYSLFNSTIFSDFNNAIVSEQIKSNLQKVIADNHISIDFSQAENDAIIREKIKSVQNKEKIKTLGCYCGILTCSAAIVTGFIIAGTYLN